MSAQFNIKAADPASVDLLQRELALPRFIAATLVARGIERPEDVRRFLAPSIERDWLDPYIIPGLSEVADALEAAVKRGDHILVFGDFDLDGISATTVLTRGLRALGAQATPFIPPAFRRRLRAVRGGVFARVLVRPGLHRDRGLRHRLQSGGGHGGGGRSRPGRHRPPRAG